MRLVITVVLWLTLGILTPAEDAQAQARDLIVATTTSTQDSGLLDSLVPRFERRCGCRVKTIAVGTGQSLALGARGEADVVLVHAPDTERRYVAQGHYTARRLVMSNDFLLVGPADDPARVKGVTDLDQVLRQLALGRAPFVSRGDSSGTHLLELRLWMHAGIPPEGAWYLEAGQGMGATLRIASEKAGYTLTDRGTFLALARDLNLVGLVEGAASLLNIYHVMLVNPERHPGVNAAGARAFAAFMVSAEVQEFIREFGRARFGQPLFVPQAGRTEAELLGTTPN